MSVAASKKRRALSVTWTQILPPTDLSDSQDDVASQLAQLDLHACAVGDAVSAPIHGNSPRRRRRTGRVEGDESEENEQSNVQNVAVNDAADDDDADDDVRRDKSDDLDVRELDLCFDQISLDKPSRRTFMPYIS